MAELKQQLVNVGILTRAQLDEVIEDVPKSATVHYLSNETTAYGPDGYRILSAHKLASDRWQVRARAGLVERSFSKHLTY